MFHIKTIKRILKNLFVDTLCKVFFRTLPLKLGEKVYIQTHTELGTKISKRKYPIIAINVSLSEDGIEQIWYLVRSCGYTYNRNRLYVWKKRENGYWYATVSLLSVKEDKIERAEIMKILSDIVKFDNKNKEYKPLSAKLIHAIKEVFKDENIRESYKFIYYFFIGQENSYGR